MLKSLDAKAMGAETREIVIPASANSPKLQRRSTISYISPCPTSIFI